MDYLELAYLDAAVWSLSAGRQIQTVVDALEGAGIPSVLLLKGPAPSLIPENAAVQGASVIPALIKKEVRRRHARWPADGRSLGDGRGLERVLYVDDAAEGIVLATEGSVAKVL